MTSTIIIELEAPYTVLRSLEVEIEEFGNNFIARLPEAKLLSIGNSPADALKQLKANIMDTYDFVNLTSHYLSQDLRDFWTKSIRKTL